MPNFETNSTPRNPKGIRENLRNMSTVEFNVSLLKEEGGRTYLADPATRENLNRDTLPEILVQDRRLKKGYDFLR